MKSTAKSELFRELPSVDELLRAPAVAALASDLASNLSSNQGLAAVTDAARAVLARLREEISSGLLDASALPIALHGIAGAVAAQLREALTHSLRPVINATGVILHTNLGRAPGARGKRDAHVDRLFRSLLSEGSREDKAEVSTIVVNNNAAAVLLALNTLADGGEVIVSRGELVEIGGSFRIPDVMAKSGATLREV